MDLKVQNMNVACNWEVGGESGKGGLPFSWTPALFFML